MAESHQHPPHASASHQRRAAAPARESSAIPLEVPAQRAIAGAAARPTLLRKTSNVVALQRTVGNQAVQRLAVQRNDGPSRAAPSAPAPTAQAEPGKRPVEMTDVDCKLILDRCDRSWVEVKKRYVPDPPLMTRLIRYREESWTRLFEGVKRDLKADGLKTFFAGSTDLTSDVDVTVIGKTPRQEVTAVTLFNKRFREFWGKESGTVFDVNLYARDFIPQRIGEVDKDKLKKLRESLKTATDPEVKQNLQGQIDQIETQANEINQEVVGEDSWQQTQANEQEILELNDVMALLKMRRFMSDEAWADHMQASMTGAKDPKTQSEIRDRFKKADDLFREIKSELDGKIVALNQKLFPQIKNVAERAEKITDAREDAEMQASNRLYEATLIDVAEIGDQIDTLKAEVKKSGVRTPQQAKELDRLTNAYMQVKTKALVFANESYHTGGTLKDVVLNRQSNLGIQLTIPDYMQSINEQAGFVAEQLNHKGDPAGYRMWKAGKYLERLVLALSSVRDIAKKDARLPEVPKAEGEDTVLTIARQLLGVKKDDSLKSDQARNEKAVEKAAAFGFATVGDPRANDRADNAALLSFVLKFNAAANQIVRPLIQRQRPADV